MQNIEKKVDDGFEVTQDRFDSIENLIKDFAQKSEDRFASKWVEQAVKWVCALVATAVVGAVLSLVIK